MARAAAVLLLAVAVAAGLLEVALPSEVGVSCGEPVALAEYLRAAGCELERNGCGGPSDRRCALALAHAGCSADELSELR